jgi:glycosyltransferase involved in cell wall biosynthesis
LIPAIQRAVPDLHILVVDDNSPDETGQAVLDLAADQGGKISLLSRPAKDGLAQAYSAGFKEALRRGYDLILQMDADLSHDPSYLPAFLQQIASFDLVLGSRYLRGVNVVNWDFKRLILSKMASVYVRWVTRMPFSDLTGGFKCWKRETLEQIDLERIFSNGYLFQIEMWFSALACLTWKAYGKHPDFADGRFIPFAGAVFSEQKLLLSTPPGSAVWQEAANRWNIILLAIRSLATQGWGRFHLTNIATAQSGNRFISTMSRFSAIARNMRSFLVV